MLMLFFLFFLSGRPTSSHHLQVYDKARNALALALSPVVRALVDPDGAMKDIRNLDSVRNMSFI